MCLGLHRATIRREKRAQRARGEGWGARQTSNRHLIGAGVVRSITSTGPVARAPSCAAVRASVGLRELLIPSDGIGKGKGIQLQARGERISNHISQSHRSGETNAHARAHTHVCVLDRAWPRRVCCASPTRVPSACHVPSTRNTHTHTHTYCPRASGPASCTLPDVWQHLPHRDKSADEEVLFKEALGSLGTLLLRPPQHAGADADQPAAALAGGLLAAGGANMAAYPDRGWESRRERFTRACGLRRSLPSSADELGVSRRGNPASKSRQAWV
jgi:hypothetical protein